MAHFRDEEATAISAIHIIGGPLAHFRDEEATVISAIHIIGGALAQESNGQVSYSYHRWTVGLL